MEDLHEIGDIEASRFLVASVRCPAGVDTVVVSEEGAQLGFMIDNRIGDRDQGVPPTCLHPEHHRSLAADLNCLRHPSFLVKQKESNFTFNEMTGFVLVGMLVGTIVSPPLSLQDDHVVEVRLGGGMEA